MANSWQCVLALVVVILCSRLPLVCVAAKGGGETCSEEQAVRLDAVQANTSCGYVEGRVQVCEDGVWKSLCDSSWTVEDAQVACKFNNYTALGAQNRTMDQTVGKASMFGVDCTGEEDSISECTRTRVNDDGVCQKSISVLCFTDESRASMECMDSDTTIDSEPPKPPTTPTPEAGETTAPKTPPPSSTARPTSGSGATTDSSSMTESRGFFAPPTLYYFIGGLSAIILAAVLLILVTVICCCSCLRHKVSPADSEQQKSKLQAPYGEESQKSKDHTTTHHQIQQSSPIYEAISNEDSSTHSQGSPTSKPLMPPASGELYATLDNTNTYAQIQPHIPVKTTTSTPATPDPNTNYQVLQHRSFSLRRDLPSRHHAVNRTALALAQGEVEERDLPGQNKASGVVAGSSKSLPRNTGYSSTSLPLPPEPVPQAPQQQQVQLQNLATESSEQTNIYHILEPPPQYGNLEQIREHSQVSSKAVCNSNRQSPPFSPKYSSQHGQLPPHPRSATLPSMHSSSPRTSRTNSQSSNSPQSQRQSKSPQISRAGGVQRASRPSESPGSTRGASSSPNVNCSAISNRLSGHSGHSDSNDIQSIGERSVIDTLV